MSERKLEEIETLFKKTTKPKLEIEEITPIKSLGIVLDNTPQSQLALDLVINLANRLELPIDVVITQNVHDAFFALIDSTKKQIIELTNYANDRLKEGNVFAKQDVIISLKVEQTLDVFEQQLSEEETLSGKLARKLEEKSSDIIVLGVPMFKAREENEGDYLGGYVSSMLRERRIHSNFLLVSDNINPELEDRIISFVSIEQQPGSIVALTRRALTLSTPETDIHIIGMLQDKVIETVARVDDEDENGEEGIDEPLDLERASEKLETKMSDTFDAIVIDEKIEHGSFNVEVQKGSATSIVSQSLEKHKPGLVLVRSVAQIEENLDPIAEQITRIVLKSGYPCLVVWD